MIRNDNRTVMAYRVGTVLAVGTILAATGLKVIKFFAAFVVLP